MYRVKQIKVYAYMYSDVTGEVCTGTEQRHSNFFIDKIKSFLYEVIGKQVCLNNNNNNKNLHPWYEKVQQNFFRQGGKSAVD